MPANADEAALEANWVERDLADALQRYRSEWGDLPTTQIASGGALEEGDSGERVSALRARLGLSGGTKFDAALAERVRLFRDMHGLSQGEHVDAEMIAALNRGADHYIAILDQNLARARDLPDFLGHRYVFVDIATQHLSMMKDGEVEDTMRVVVGRSQTQTPIMAGLIRHAVLNPYWNVPVDLVRDRYASRVINGGRAYLNRTGFRILSGFGDDAVQLQPSEVDWDAVRSGELDLRLRQEPGVGNGMGSVKFMFPNDLGIFLHDTPSTHLFEDDERLFSAGCVRLERPEALGRWLMEGEMPEAGDDPEQVVPLVAPVPIYITYFTAMPQGDRIEFREDIYGHDAV
ncbi:L,D-transpeptidase family protein [Aurantiacibacter aquimixticola]|nr:L,D-transpeptidase family protein [Aurantiacibacter aquimixticola]